MTCLVLAEVVELDFVRIVKKKTMTIAKSGFSIIELLVVISVLTILIGIGIPKIKGFKDNANLLKAKGELKAIQAALQSYYIFSSPNAYPASTTSITTTLSTATPKVISGVLYDPFGATATTEYNYLRSSNGKYFVAYSVGLNGAIGSIAVSTAGVVTRSDADDMCVTNGTGCDEGVLNCYAGYTKCSGVCVNLLTDANNCNGCGNVCDPTGCNPGDQLCTAGICLSC